MNRRSFNMDIIKHFRMLSERSQLTQHSLSLTCCSNYPGSINCSQLCQTSGTRASRLITWPSFYSPRKANRNGEVKVRSLVYESTLRVQGMQVTSPKAWEIISTALRDSKVKIISQQELLFAKEKGAVVIDIRPNGEYELGHIEGSVNVSLFRLITGWDPVKALRRAGFAFFGVFHGTEVNPNFETQIFEIPALDSEKTGVDIPVVLVCQTGGTLESSTSFKNGKQSRSLIAAFEMLKLGFKTISVLKGGFSEWKRNERPYVVADSVNES